MIASKLHIGDGVQKMIKSQSIDYQTSLYSNETTRTYIFRLIPQNPKFFDEILEIRS
jgi:hypothetical protein